MPEKSGALTALSAIFDKYDGILSDVWGVIHNGVEAHPSAVAALREYRQQGGRVILITNAARTAPVIAKLLEKFNIPRDTYDTIISSGDVTRTLIEKYSGEVIHHVGPASDHPIFEGLDIIKGPASEARVVVVTGLDSPQHTPDNYTERLAEWAELGLPMICANPDKIVEVGDRIVYCAGSLADLYAEAGGKVAMVGKPYAPIYEASVKSLDEVAGRKVARSRVLAIGDSERTDATGAANADLDFLFITGSIHAGELDAFGKPDADAIHRLLQPSGVRLIGFQSRLI